ncbi:hypothetical protein K440DRAFT_640125 [Wilcoxina mikolae CBS 423.85]|nr:hypothetical protein K440DRAFT_640125 [Wilcoxina mikolae CBS 423.85]
MLQNGQISIMKGVIEETRSSLKYSLNRAINNGDDEARNVVEEVLPTGVRILIVSLECGTTNWLGAVDGQHDRLIKSLSTSFVDGLKEANAHFGKDVVRLIKDRRVQFNDAVRNRNFDLAKSLFKAAQSLLDTATSQGCGPIVKILTDSREEALQEAATCDVDKSRYT